MPITEEIINELKNIIEIPTVLLDKEGVPIEYKNTRKKRKMKIRKIDNISVHLLMFILENNGDASSIEKFSSGNFVSFLNMNRAYSL